MPRGIPVSRRCILVLGMHRSGTSAIAQLFSLLGAAGPRETMPASADNPLGYWESPGIARLNNRLLESAGTRWNDESAVAKAWFDDPARGSDRAEARQLMEAEFPADATIVCKDPRICRLLPFWRHVLEEMEIPLHAVLMLRDPEEVARSLAARAAQPSFRPAAIVARERAVLLWLRYVIDAERHSRGLPRQAINFAGLLADWRAAVSPLIQAGVLPPITTAASTVADAFIDPALRRQHAARPLGPSANPVAPAATLPQRLLATMSSSSALPADGGAAAACNAVGESFDRLVAAYQPLRSGRSPLEEADPWAAAILASLESQPEPVCRPASRGSVAFISGVPTSVGHVYRVEHAIQALTTAGWQANWRAVDDPLVLSQADTADVVVAFRTAWNDTLATVATRCRQRGIPLVYDVDDLIFDPALMNDGSIAVLSALPDADRRQFVAAAATRRTMIEHCDAAVVSTRPLADATARLCPHSFVLPNSLSPEMESAALAAVASVEKDSARDGRLRLCFASGTPSHNRDFAVAAEGIASLFASRPEPRLVVIGDLDIGIYDCLRPFADRLDWRPRVPLMELFAEVARCDINLAPLESGNPFCEGKSAVRCLVAAAVGLPTVASPTVPLREAIIPEETGLLARDAADWKNQLDRLLADAAFCSRLGKAARIHALADYGFTAYRERVAGIFDQLVSLGRKS